MNENKFFSTDLDGVTVTLAMYVPSGTQKRVHANRSDHGFAIYANAESVVEFDTGKTFSIGDGQALFFPRGSNYVVKSTIGSGGCYAINFLCPPLDGAEPFVVTTKNREAFLSAFRKASQAFVSRLEGYKEVCLAMLAAVAARIKTENAYVPSGKAEIVRPAIDYARENYTDPELAIADLAAAAGISEVYLRRLFRSVYGIKPNEFAGDTTASTRKSVMPPATTEHSAASLGRRSSSFSHASRIAGLMSHNRHFIPFSYLRGTMACRPFFTRTAPNTLPETDAWCPLMIKTGTFPICR